MANTEHISPSIDATIFDFLNQSLKTESYKLIPLAGDASNRRYFRVVQDLNSYVLMVWEPFTDIENYPFLSVQNLFKSHGVHVPEILALSPQTGLILLEDLGDLTLERKFSEHQNTDNVIPFYKMAIDELLKIHFQATSEKNKTATCFKLNFDEEKLMWEMNYAKTHLLEKLCELNLNTSTSNLLEKDFTNICQILDKQPKRICHRDYHSRNLMLKLDKMRVIDFQDARMGPVQYDLVSLLCDSYVDMDSAASQKLIAYYLDKAQSDFDVFYNFEEFMHIFNIQLVQRCFKACGSFASFYNTRGDVRYLEYIQPTLVKIVATLEELNLFPTLLKVIKENHLLEIDFEAP